MKYLWHGRLFSICLLCWATLAQAQAETQAQAEVQAEARAKMKARAEAQAQAETQAETRADTKVLVLQWEVSHSRNTDQTSLIFRPQKVELVTNVFFYQKGQKARLGRFQSSLTPEWQAVQKKLNRYHKQLKKTVPLSSLIKDDRFKPRPDPHAPVLHLNQEELREGQTYFKELSDMIRQVWNHKWLCVECAEYQRQKKTIIRTVKKRVDKNKSLPNTKEGKKSALQSKKKPPVWQTQKTTFSLKHLNCISKAKGRLECVDEEFGIFEI